MLQHSLFNDIYFLSQKLKNFTINISSANSRSQGNKNIDSFLEVFRQHWCSNEHLSCSLTMPNIRQLFLSSQSQDIVNKGRNIMNSHFFEGEVPILRHVNRIIWIKRLVVETIQASSIVSHPDIVSSFCKNKSRCFFRAIKDPRHHISCKTMHKKDCWLFCKRLFLMKVTWYPKEGQDIPIWCGNHMLFNSKVVLFGNLFHTLESIMVWSYIYFCTWTFWFRLLTKVG